MAGTRSALIVAAYDFQDEKFRELRAPAHDAEALAEVLGDDGIGGFDVKTLINEPGSTVAQELEAFCSDRTADDLLLLYFSCHGIKDASGRLYFAMANTRFDRLRSTGVSATFVSEQMEYSRSRRIALLLDCCYSGAFVKGLRARASEEVQVKDHFEGRGRAVITASRATEYAFEGDELSPGQGQPSLFTNAIVQGLATGKADRDGDGLITVDELYDYVYDEVRGKVAGQTPGRWVDLEGELVVARNPHPPVVARELPLELANAVHSESAPHRIGAVTLLAAWLERGSPAEFLTAQAELTRLADDPDVRVKQAATEMLARGTVAVKPETATGPSPAAPPQPPSTPPPDRPVSDGRPEPPGPVAAAADTHPEPSAPAVSVAPFPVAAVLGAVLLVVAIFTPTTVGGAELVRDLYVAPSPALAAALALIGAALVRGPGDRRIGLALLVGVMPTVVVFSLAVTASIMRDGADPGAGMAFLYAGSALLVVAGGRAVAQLRGSVRLVDQPTRTDMAVAFFSGLLGLGAAMAFGDDSSDVNEGEFLTLAWRLTLLFGGAVALRYWRAGARLVPRRAVAPVTAVLAMVAAALFLSFGDFHKPYQNVLLWVVLVAAIASAIIPLISALLIPHRAGAAMMGAWAAAQGALLVRRPLLCLPYLAVLAVAIVLWRRTGDDDIPVVVGGAGG